MNSLITCVSQTNKSTCNQDFCGVIFNEKANFKGVIVSDGISSHPRSELSSKFCTNQLITKLEKVNTKDDVDFNLFFAEIKSELKLYAKTVLSDAELINNNFGTTLICVLEFEDEYFFAYIGNGSIWHISGNFNHFGKNRYLPWNSNNILNPHTIDQEGISALYKFISINDFVSCRPTIVKISKDEELYGNVILITTDGVFTNDEAKIGKDDNGIIWIMGEESMTLFYEKLNAFFKINYIENLENKLQEALDEYLSELRQRNIMHDDTTLGIIISTQSLNYQKTLVSNAHNNINETDTDSELH